MIKEIVYLCLYIVGDHAAQGEASLVKMTLRILSQT